MATKAKNSGWSSNLRKGFNLEAEEQEPTPIEALEAPLNPSQLAGPVSVAADLMPLTNGSRPVSPTSARERGRPKTTVERFPKTVYLTPSAELALRRSVEQMQQWRGRRRGVLKVQESETANLALEYLYRRLTEGEEAAEAYYRQSQADEQTRFPSTDDRKSEI